MLNTRNAPVSSQKPTGPRRALLAITAAALAGVSVVALGLPQMTPALASSHPPRRSRRRWAAPPSRLPTSSRR